jgi:hypothetical protein
MVLRRLSAMESVAEARSPMPALSVTRVLDKDKGTSG